MRMIQNAHRTNWQFWVVISASIVGGLCMDPFIVGGVSAKITAFPHSVFLSAQNKDRKYEWICGSSVLNQKILLTAAHCIIDCYNANCKLSAFAGSENIKKSLAVRRVKQFLPHEDYSPDSVICDIGLVGLDKELPLGNTIKRVLIPKSYKKTVRNAFLAGWGVIDDQTFKETVILQMLKQKIRPASYCSKVGLQDSESTFCAGVNMKTRPRAAAGDSGSALMVGHYAQIGLVSYKPANSAITIYTNTTYFLDWIEHSSKVLFCAE